MWRAVRLLAVAPLFGCSEYGVEQLRFVEDFLQPDLEAAADVLFVVDDSASMAEEQEQLAENFAAFVEVVEGTYADFHLGVVTTDVEAEDAGLLRNGVLAPDTPDLAEAFVEAVDVGTKGARDERGLEAAALAVDGRNPGFLREDTKLNVVIFSDEDDHSEGTVESWIFVLEEVAGMDRVAVHSVVGDLPDGCVSGTTAADAGDRYVAAAVNTDGWRASICADSYTDILTRVGLDVAGLSDTFVLENVPTPESLVVKVDEVLIPEREVDGWTYDPGDNAIVFHGRAIPRPGMTVTVAYELHLGETYATK